MNNKFKNMFLTSLICSMMFGGCSDNEWDKYYGKYNGYDVGIRYVKGDMITVLAEEIVADTLFKYPSPNPIVARKNGKNYCLQEVYDNGSLTRENIRHIGYLHHGREINLENHAGLTYGSLNTIWWAYKIYLTEFHPTLNILDIVGVRYYGYYNPRHHSMPYEHIAVMMCAAYDNVPWETTVAGVLFRCNDGNRILIFRISDYQFYELQDAYDLGFLSENDVKAIAYYHENEKYLSY